MSHLRVMKALEPFSALWKDQPVAVAVSGGPDSMALCHGLKHLLPQKVIPLIVDHGLRSESTREAHTVAGVLASWGMDPYILLWQGAKPTHGLQEKARFVRHHLLYDWCFQHRILFLCMGHHADDQEETQMMRLLQGSHVRGMGGMKETTSHPFGFLIRPFLSLRKADLYSYCQAHHIPYVVDPSNLKRTFLRTRLRSLKQAAPCLFHFPKNHLNQEISAWVGRFIWRHGSLVEGVFFLDFKAFLALPVTFQKDFLRALITAWGVKKNYEPRTKSLDFLIMCMITERKTSLRGLIFFKKNGFLCIQKEGVRGSFIEVKPTLPHDRLSFLG